MRKVKPMAVVTHDIQTLSVYFILFRYRIVEKNINSIESVTCLY